MATRRDGSHEHPYSAYGLRLVLACFGLVSMGVLGWLSLRAGLGWLGWACLALALTALVDIVVILLRLRSRKVAG